MFRLWCIALLFVGGMFCELYSASHGECTSGGASEVFLLKAADRPFTLAESNETTQLTPDFEMLGSDGISTVASRTISSGSVRSVEHILRLRSLSKDGVSCEFSAASRPRHITKIFDFNIPRSSLRVGYYLYTLCRLRI